MKDTKKTLPKPVQKKKTEQKLGEIYVQSFDKTLIQRTKKPLGLSPNGLDVQINN